MVDSPVDHSIERPEEALDVGEIFVKVSLGVKVEHLIALLSGYFISQKIGCIVRTVK